MEVKSPMWARVCLHSWGCRAHVHCHSIAEHWFSCSWVKMHNADRPSGHNNKHPMRWIPLTKPMQFVTLGDRKLSRALFNSVSFNIKTTGCLCPAAWAQLVGVCSSLQHWVLCSQETWTAVSLRHRAAGDWPYFMAVGQLLQSLVHKSYPEKNC